MIDGLKLTLRGVELIRWIEDRIERYHARIQYNRDEIEGKIDKPPGPMWAEVTAECVEDEIRQHEYRIRVLTIIRDHVVPDETYLIGKADLAFGELLPDPPEPRTEWDISKGIRWVARPIDFDRPRPEACSPGD